LFSVVPFVVKFLIKPQKKQKLTKAYCLLHFASCGKVFSLNHTSSQKLTLFSLVPFAVKVLIKPQKKQKFTKAYCLLYFAFCGKVF